MGSASLSDLPRAALSAKEGYWWINGIALALSAVVANMSWSAYSAIGASDRALVCIITQGVAVAAAILSRRASTGQMGFAALACLALAGGCAWWSSHGLALAWYGNADRNGEPMVIFMAALEPALFLLAEHIKEGREALRAAHEKAERETAEELAAIRARQSGDRPLRQPFHPKVVEDGRTVATVAAVSVGMTGAMAEAPTGSAAFAIPLTEQVSHSHSTFANAEDHARALLAAGKSQRAAARETGLTRYMIGQLVSGAAA
jgi:hypothetical protein